MTTIIGSLVRRPIAAIALLALSGALGGCQTLGMGGNTLESSAPAELSPTAAAAIAGDLVPRLAEQLGQGQATVRLNPDGSVFGAALETSLRTWGYAVTTDRTANGVNIIPLAYILVPVDGKILARLSTGSVELGRIYSATAVGAAPASPLSVMQRG